MHNPEVTYPSVFGIEQTPTHWQAAFDEASSWLPKEIKTAFDPIWMKASALPFPTIKVEKWRWLDFSGMRLNEAKLWAEPQLSLDIEHILPDEAGTDRLNPLPEGVVITRLAEALRQRPGLTSQLLQQVDGTSSDKLQTLAEALGRNGLFVFVPRGIKVDGVAIARLRGRMEPGLSLTRSLIWLEAGAELSLVLDFKTQPSAQMGLVSHLGKTDVILEDGAKLNYTDISIYQQYVINLSYSQARLQKNANLTWIYSAAATELGKQSLEVDLVGEGAVAEVAGEYFPSEGQRISMDTVQNHLAARTRSNLLFRGAAIGNGEAIWRGMVYVDPAAQKTDGYQSNQNLMLGERSDVKSIPGLEICADDVSCSHGATVGRIDETELFYLAARGIPRVEAERLIVEGFFDEIIERIPDDKTKDDLRERLMQKFEAS